LRLGLPRLASAVAGATGTCLVGIAAAVTFTAVTSGEAATATDQGPAWSVTLGDASRALFPGTDATMSYDVQNVTGGTQRLHGTTVELKSDGVGLYDTVTHRYVEACQARWFRISGNSVANDVDVAPGAPVHGTLSLAFDGASVTQDACKGIGIEVVVTAS